jgi:hypothetical protein
VIGGHRGDDDDDEDHLPGLPAAVRDGRRAGGMVAEPLGTAAGPVFVLPHSVAAVEGRPGAT